MKDAIVGLFLSCLLLRMTFTADIYPVVYMALL